MTDLTLIVNPSLGINAIPTLNQTFNALPAFRKGGTPINSPCKRLSDPTFSWKSGYIWEHNCTGTPYVWPPVDGQAYPASTSDGDADFVPNADMIAKTGISPYSWDANDGLIISAIPTPAGIASLINKEDAPATYMSGAITSFPYCQTYGVFAAVMKLPKAAGMWPAFWMLPFNKKWPPELDIMEAICNDTETLYTTLHTSAGTKGKPTKTVDLSLDFHEYAVDWGPDVINWYLDRKLVFTQPTPPGLHQPAYLLANLAVGKPGQWGGPPAMGPDGQPILAPLKIKSIKAWQRPAYI